MGLQGLRPKTLTSGQRAANLEQGRTQSPVLLLRLLEGLDEEMSQMDSESGAGRRQQGLARLLRCVLFPHTCWGIFQSLVGVPQRPTQNLGACQGLWAECPTPCPLSLAWLAVWIGWRPYLAGEARQPYS